MNTLNGIICNHFKCLDGECSHHKNKVTTQMQETSQGFAGNFLFKMAPKTHFYDCSMDYFKGSTTYVFEYEKLSKSEKEIFEQQNNHNSNMFNWKYGADDNAIQEFLNEREKQII